MLIKGFWGRRPVKDWWMMGHDLVDGGKIGDMRNIVLSLLIDGILLMNDCLGICSVGCSLDKAIRNDTSVRKRRLIG